MRAFAIVAALIDRDPSPCSHATSISGEAALIGSQCRCRSNTARRRLLLFAMLRGRLFCRRCRRRHAARTMPSPCRDVLTSNLAASMISAIRTTLTIDDDLAALLKRRARERGASFKDVVNRALRAGLGEEAKPRRRRKPCCTRSASGRESISTSSISSPTNSKPRALHNRRRLRAVFPDCAGSIRARAVSRKPR